MQKASITLLLAVVCIFSTFSQVPNSASFFNIKGTVIDSVSTETIPFVTISASKTKMPAMPFKRVAADAQGKFELSVNSSDQIVLKFEAVGMKPATLVVSDFTN